MSLPRLAVIVPSYNEAEVLPKSIPEIISVLRDLKSKGLVSQDSYVLIVDDGSTDGTWEVVKSLSEKYGEEVRAFRLSRNFGHQSALLCGLLEGDYHIAITIDADLQDPPEVMEEMVKRYHEGFKVVYGVRKDRSVDSAFKRATAGAFYKFMRSVGVKLIENHADYRLISREVRDVLAGMEEVNLFLRGLIPYVGFKSTEVYYERAKRVAGETKYPLRKMLSFAWEGITSFSTLPLRIITIVGFLIFVASLLMSVWAVFVKLSGRSIAGWLSVVLPMYMIGGLNLFFIGIIGEYVGKIYMETKRRPRYIVEERL